MSTLGPIDTTQLPADIRKASKADQQRYSSALSFEQTLVAQLTQGLADTATSPVTGGDDDASGSDATTNAYKQMVPDALSKGIMQSGGLGLARQLYNGMTEQGK